MVLLEGVFLARLRHAAQGPAVEIVFQPAGLVLGVGRTVGTHVRLVIVQLPLPCKGRRESGVGPELRFFQVDGEHAGVDHGLELLRHVIGELDRRHHIGNARAVEPFFALGVHLRQGHDVPAVDVLEILIVAPGDAGHQVGHVALVDPGLDRGDAAFVCPIHHHEIVAQIIGRRIGPGVLKPGQLQSAGP